MEVTKKRRSNTADRIVLTEETQVQLKSHALQIEQSTGGMVTIPLRELANFLLQIRGLPLSEHELMQLRLRYFDEMKALKWAMNEVKMAKSRGESVNLVQVLKKLEMQGVGEKGRSKSSSGIRKKKKQDPVASALEGHSKEPSNAPDSTL